MITFLYTTNKNSFWYGFPLLEMARVIFLGYVAVFSQDYGLLFMFTFFALFVAGGLKLKPFDDGLLCFALSLFLLSVWGSFNKDAFEMLGSGLFWAIVVSIAGRACYELTNWSIDRFLGKKQVSYSPPAYDPA